MDGLIILIKLNFNQTKPRVVFGTSREPVLELLSVDTPNTDFSIMFGLQGAPGNRGFPGQDGLAGPKVSISSHQFH